MEDDADRLLGLYFPPVEPAIFRRSLGSEQRTRDYEPGDGPWHERRVAIGPVPVGSSPRLVYGRSARKRVLVASSQAVTVDADVSQVTRL